MKKMFRNLLTGCLMLMLALILVPGVKADAALTQSGATTNSATVSWSAQSDAIKYVVYLGTSYSEMSQYAELSPSQTSVTISGLPAGSSRYVQVRYVKQTSTTGSSTAEYTVGYMEVVTVPGKVTNLNQERWYYYTKSFYAEWDKQEDVTGYEYVVKNSKGKVVAQSTSTSSYFRVGNISNAMVYSGQVRAYTRLNSQTTYYGAWSDVAYFFTQPQVSKAKVSGGKLTVKWKKVNGATGYDIYVSTKAQTGYKKVKSVKSSKSSVTVAKFNKKKFSAKKKYYVYVVTKKKTGTGTYTSGRLYFWNTKSSGYEYFS